MPRATAGLHLHAVRAGYGGGQVLHGVSLAVPAGTVGALVGPNGAGKSTLLHAIAGLVPPAGGRIWLGETVLSGRPPHWVARAGVGLVPQGRRVFAGLTVAEHFRVARPHRPGLVDSGGGGGRQGHRTDPGAWDVPRILDLFPRLGQRLRHRGDQLSGGEQQMLAIARALLRQPRLLLLDEACEGLAPDLAARIRALARELAAGGMTVLLVEQGLDAVLDVANRVLVLDHGRLIADGDAAVVRADPVPYLAAMGEHSGQRYREAR